MYPLIKLLDQLVIGEGGVFDALVKLLNRQVTGFDIGSLSGQVLTAGRASHGLIDSGTAIATVDKKGPPHTVTQGLKDMDTKQSEVVDHDRPGVKLLIKAISGSGL